MPDYLVRAVTKDGHLRAIGLDATDTVGEAQQRHDTYGAASAALGRTLIGTILLSNALLKDDAKETLTTRVLGDGPVGAIVAVGTPKGTVKGYIQHPHVQLPLNTVGKIDVRRAVGKGLLAVTKDLGLKQPFTGQVPIVSGELAEDFSYYLAKSEQIPSAVGLSVFVQANNTIGAAGGFMVQAMPGASDAELVAIEKKIKALPLISEMMRAGDTPEDILAKIFGADNIKFLDTQAVSFKCDCSKARFGKSIQALGHHDIQEMIDEDHGAEAVCKFCGNQYHFSENELKAMLAK